MSITQPPERERLREQEQIDVLLGATFFDEIQDKTVIDFGCGTGAEAVEMAQRGARRVIGLDIREEWLIAARARADAAGVADRCAQDDSR